MHFWGVIIPPEGRSIVRPVGHRPIDIGPKIRGPRSGLPPGPADPSPDRAASAAGSRPGLDQDLDPALARGKRGERIVDALQWDGCRDDLADLGVGQQ